MRGIAYSRLAQVNPPGAVEDHGGRLPIRVGCRHARTDVSGVSRERPFAATESIPFSEWRVNRAERRQGQNSVVGTSAPTGVAKSDSGQFTVTDPRRCVLGLCQC